MHTGDNQHPSCSRCTLLNRECVRAPPDPFRHTYNPTVKPVDSALEPRPEYEYADDQVWLTPTSNGSYTTTRYAARANLYSVVEFVYEDPSDEPSPFEAVDSHVLSSRVSLSAELRASPPANQQGQYITVYQTLQERSLPSPPFYGSLEGTSARAGSANNTAGPPSPRSEWIRNTDIWQSENTNRNTQGGRQAVSTDVSTGGSFSSPLPSSPQTPNTVCPKKHWPLTDESEAILLRHFVAKLSLWVKLLFSNRSAYETNN